MKVSRSLLESFQVAHEIAFLRRGEREPERRDVVLDDILERGRTSIVEVRSLQLRWVPEPAQWRRAIALRGAAQRVRRILADLRRVVEDSVVDVSERHAVVAARA